MEEATARVSAPAEMLAVTPETPSRMRRTPISQHSDVSSDEAPEYKCAICLGRLRNKSLIDSCFHEFCFDCLVEWSKVKAECPLCKAKFEYIIHNVKSNNEYEKYHCQNNQRDGDLQIPWATEPRRSFRYRTTMIPRLQETLAVQQIVALREMRNAGSASRPRTRASQRNSEQIPSFRSRVYIQNLWVQPLSDVTNRFRECSPQFYEANPAQVYRLVRWLERELTVLLPLNSPHRTFVTQTIVNNVFRLPIRSPSFAAYLQPYLGANTRHFIHEFAEYARSPFDMAGHDRAATYVPQSSAAIEEVVLNSPTCSELSDDHQENLIDLLNTSGGSDVEIVESISAPAPVAGPSGVSRARAPSRPKPTKPTRQLNPILPLSNEETHEIISSSSSDECEIIGTFRPPTPEVIDILSDDDEEDLLNEVALSPIYPAENNNSISSCVSFSSRSLLHLEEGEMSRSPVERPHIALEESNTGFLDDNPPDMLIVKTSPGRIKRKIKKRKRKDSDSLCSSSSSERSRSRQSSLNKWDWRGSGSPELPARLPSVVIPQPSFMVEAGSSRLGGSYEEVVQPKRETKERTKRKKSKHSRKHRRTHRLGEDEERGEGTSGSGSSRRCKACRHRHCHCNMVRRRKKRRSHHRELVTEEREESGSSRSKTKKFARIKYDRRISDSSD